MWRSLCSLPLRSECCSSLSRFQIGQNTLPSHFLASAVAEQATSSYVESGLASGQASSSHTCSSSSSNSSSSSRAISNSSSRAISNSSRPCWQSNALEQLPQLHRSLSTSSTAAQAHQQHWQQQPQSLQHINPLQHPLLLQQQQCLPQLQQHVQHLAGLRLQQQRGVKQLRPYAEAPKLPPKFKRPDKDGRMNRMVIRIPPQVQVSVEGTKLLLTGKAGSTSVDLSVLDPSGLVAWQCLTQSTAAAAAGPGTGSLLLMCSPSKKHWRSIQTHIDNAVNGVMQGYLVGLTVQGVGYRLEPVSEDVVKAAIRARKGDAAAEDSSVKRPMFWEQEAEKSNIAYPHKQPAKAVRLKVGFTKAAIYPLPDGVLGLCVKPSLMYLYGIDKQLVTNTAAAIRAVRKPNAYTGNGIQLVGETIKLKQRAGSK